MNAFVIDDHVFGGRVFDGWLFVRLVVVGLLLAAISACSAPDTAPMAGSFTDADWPAYGRDQQGTKFSPLATIDRTNVASLEVAWTWETGELPLDGPSRPIRTPISSLSCSRETVEPNRMHPICKVVGWQFHS